MQLTRRKLLEIDLLKELYYEMCESTLKASHESSTEGGREASKMEYKKYKAKLEAVNEIINILTA